MHGILLATVYHIFMWVLVENTLFDANILELLITDNGYVPEIAL